MVINELADHIAKKRVAKLESQDKTHCEGEACPGCGGTLRYKSNNRCVACVRYYEARSSRKRLDDRPDRKKTAKRRAIEDHQERLNKDEGLL